MTTTFFLIILGLVLSAFFSGMEMAFITANRLKIEIDNQQGKWYGRVLSKFVDDPAPLISTFLVGNNIALVIFGLSFNELFDPVVQQWIKENYLQLIITTIASTAIVLVFAEFIPKIIFGLQSDAALQTFFPLMFLFYIIFYPIVFLVNQFILLIYKITGNHQQENKRIFSKHDLDHMIENINEEVEENLYNELEILKNALEFTNLKIRDCMVPRTEICAIEIDQPIEQLKKLFIETGYSKILVYRDNIDNIIGYVHSFEMYKKPESIKQVLKSTIYLPETMSAQNALKQLIKQRKSIAVVLDEFGGTAGIVSIEDIVEQIFGEIEDEHDEQELTEKKISDNEYLLSGRLEVDYLNKKYGWEIPENENYSTLAGLVLHHMQSIPKPNDRIVIDNYTIIVKQVNNKTIDLVLLKIND